MSEADKARNAVSSLEKRIAKTQQKLDQAQADGDDNAAILSDTLAKLQGKLDEARQALDALSQEEN